MIADSWCWLISLTYISIFGSTNATAQGWPSLGRMDWFRIACLRRPQWIVPWIQYDLVMCMTLAYFGWKYVYEFNGYHMSSSFSVFCRYWWVTWPFGGYIYTTLDDRIHIFFVQIMGSSRNSHLFGESVWWQNLQSSRPSRQFQVADLLWALTWSYSMW